MSGLGKQTTENIMSLALLSSCGAVAVGKSPGQERLVTSVAQRCGFGLVGTLSDASSVITHTKLHFVLIHHLLGDVLLGNVVKSIRSGGDRIRFSPIVVVADDCPFERIISFIEQGVDDVVNLPDKRELLVQRLAAQLGTEHMYMETADYFGPDRHRMTDGAGVERRKGAEGYSRYFFTRSPSGLKIVRHQIFSTPGRKLELGS